MSHSRRQFADRSQLTRHKHSLFSCFAFGDIIKDSTKADHFTLSTELRGNRHLDKPRLTTLCRNLPGEPPGWLACYIDAIGIFIYLSSILLARIPAIIRPYYLFILIPQKTAHRIVDKNDVSDQVRLTISFSHILQYSPVSLLALS